MSLEWIILGMSTTAVIGGLVRIYQNERFYRFHKRVHKKRKKK